METHRKNRTFADSEHAEGHVRVLVTGFSRQKIVTVQDITELIDRLPDYHLVGLDEITYDPKRELDPGADWWLPGCRSRHKAAYFPDEKRIVVYEFDTKKIFSHVLLHEIGHHVFDRILEAELRKRWMTHVSRKASHITRYAAKNPEEDFAECYSVFVHSPKKLQRIGSKYVFLRDRVFSGICFNPKKLHLDVAI
jgi:hypothetical protein